LIKITKKTIATWVTVMYHPNLVQRHNDNYDNENDNPYIACPFASLGDEWIFTGK